MTEPSDAGQSPQTPERKRPRLSRTDFLAGLAGTFLFGWAASWVGSQAQLPWLHYLGLTFVASSMLVLMIWLSRVR